MVAGVTIMMGGTASLEVPVAGVPIIAYGGDVTSSGFMELIYGKPQKTITQQVLEDHAMPEKDAKLLTDVSTDILTLSPVSYETNPSMFKANIKADLEVEKDVAAAEKKELKIGKYGDMVHETKGTGLVNDHIPSFASLKRAEEAKLKRLLTKAEEQTLKNASLSIAIDKRLHETTTMTFGGRNNIFLQMTDSKAPLEAIKNNINAYRPTLIYNGYTQKEIDQAIEKLSAPFKP